MVTNLSVEQVKQTLRLSLLPDHANLATQILSQLCMEEGYMNCLMQIAMELDEDMTLLAITQLHNHIRRSWNRSFYFDLDKWVISNSEKQVFVEEMLRLSVRVSHSYKLSKFMKDIVCKMGRDALGLSQ